MINYRIKRMEVALRKEVFIALGHGSNKLRCILEFN
jgi:hypothetical protein